MLWLHKDAQDNKDIGRAFNSSTHEEDFISFIHNEECNSKSKSSWILDAYISNHSIVACVRGTMDSSSLDCYS